MTHRKKTVRLSDILIPKYLPLVNDKTHMHQILTSGRAGTKSSCMAILADYLIVAEPDTAVVVMRKHHNKLRKTVYKECIRAIQRLGLKKSQFKITKSPMQMTYLANGNTIYFTGSDSIDDTKGMIDEERSIRMVVLDELTEFFDKGEGAEELSNIEATFVRGNDNFFRMLYLFNPPKNPKAPVNEWVRMMEKRSDCIHIHSSYKDVPVEWLGQKLIDAANQMAEADNKMYRWVWLGEAVGIDDLIYYMFDPDRHIRHIDSADNYAYYAIGVDYGQMNATTYQVFGMDMTNKRMQGLDEYYYSGRDTGRQKSPSDYAKDFRAMLDKLYEAHGRKRVYVYIDPSAKGLAEEIKRICPEIILRNADNTVTEGINRVQKLLSYDALFLCDKQKNAESEFYLYGYDPDSIDRGLEKPIKEHDHAMDAIRYAVMGQWRTMKRMLPYLAKEDKE